jgi:DNA-binding MarR family transcriptional regulator
MVHTRYSAGVTEVPQPSASREEGEARAPRELLAGSVGFLLSKLGFHSAGRFAASLEPLGIGPQHFALLRYIAAFEGRSQQALGEALEIPPSRMVALVDDIEQRALVERRRNPADRRAHALFLTTKGRKLLLDAIRVAAAHEEQLLADLSQKERDALRGLLQKVARGQDLPIGVHPSLARGGTVTPPPGSS